MLSLPAGTAFAAGAELAKDVYDQFIAVLDIQFRKHPAHVCANRGDGDTQFLGNLLITRTFEKLTGDLGLLWRQAKVVGQIDPFSLRKNFAYRHRHQ